YLVAMCCGGDAVGGEAIADPDRAAKLIVEAGPDDARRESVSHIADAFADVIPDVWNFLGTRAVLEVDKDRGDAGTRETAQEVEFWRFLQRAFESLGDLLEHVVDTGAGPRCLHHHRLDDERRVFVTPESHESEKTREHCHDHQIDSERSVVECPFRKIEAHITAPTRADGPSGPGAELARLR